MKKMLTNVGDTAVFAEEFIAGLPVSVDTATVVGLYGDLGAGKTTCTQAVARALGITETVVSPTFVIMKVYELSGQRWKHFIHIDAYRLESGMEMDRLGWQQLIADPSNLILIEWPERVADVMPARTQVRLEHVGETERSVEVVY